MKTMREMGAKRKILYMKPLNTKPLISIAELMQASGFCADTSTRLFLDDDDQTRNFRSC